MIGEYEAKLAKPADESSGEIAAQLEHFRSLLQQQSQEHSSVVDKMAQDHTIALEK